MLLCLLCSQLTAAEYESTESSLALQDQVKLVTEMDTAINQLLSSEQQSKAELRQTEERIKTLQQERCLINTYMRWLASSQTTVSSIASL